MSSVLEPLTSYARKEVKSYRRAEIRPILDSYDSGEECSFAHLVRLYELVEIEDRELDRCVFDDECLHVS